MSRAITSERRGVRWIWPDPDHEPKIAQTFSRKYPRATALAREMGLNVSYAQKVYHAHGDFVSSRQLTGFRTRSDDSGVHVLTADERQLLPLKVLTMMQEARQEEGPVRVRYMRALDELRRMEYRPRFISERRFPNGDSCSLWFPFTMFSTRISLHGYGQCEAECETLEGCFEFLEAETPEAGAK